LTDFKKKTQLLYFMKTHQVEAELFHVDTERQKWQC